MTKNRKNKVNKIYSKKNRIQIRSIFLGIGITLMIAGVFGIYYNIHNNDPYWSLSENGKVSFSLERPVKYNIYNNTIDDGQILKSLSYSNGNKKINALLRLPNATEKVPGIVILPDANVTKKEQQLLAKDLANFGYASITIDQRNLGIVNNEEDLNLFKNNQEPVEYAMIADALMSVNILKEQKEVNADQIVMIGISNGGRVAIITTSIDSTIKGVVGISTSGYGTNNITNINKTALKFYSSIDPDTYIVDISPRNVVLMHAINDKIIPYSLAKNTFNLAKEPRIFYTFNNSIHGYDPTTKEDLKTALTMIIK